LATEVPAKGNSTARRNRRGEVIEAAVQIFNEKGYAGASIQDVADAVGVLKGSLYHYIDSKEDLLARIFEESDAQSFSLIEESRNLDLEAVERLRWFGRSWSLWYLEHIERARIYVNEWSHLTGDRLKQVVKTRHEYEKRVEEIIDEVKRAGQAAPDLDTRYACFFVLTAINGLPTWYRRRGSDSAEHIAEVYGDMIVGMVCNSTGRSQAKPKVKAKSKAKPAGKARPASKVEAKAAPKSRTRGKANAKPKAKR
jgi:AcrR family transcriptional regulator